MILSLTVFEAKNGSNPSKYKGFGPFSFLREIVSVITQNINSKFIFIVIHKNEITR